MSRLTLGEARGRLRSIVVASLQRDEHNQWNSHLTPQELANLELAIPSFPTSRCSATRLAARCVSQGGAWASAMPMAIGTTIATTTTTTHQCAPRGPAHPPPSHTLPTMVCGPGRRAPLHGHVHLHALRRGGPGDCLASLSWAGVVQVGGVCSCSRRGPNVRPGAANRKSSTHRPYKHDTKVRSGAAQPARKRRARSRTP